MEPSLSDAETAHVVALVDPTSVAPAAGTVNETAGA
jgi:hypothetical protein